MPGRARSAPTDERVATGLCAASRLSGVEARVKCHMRALTRVPLGAVGAGCTTRSDCGVIRLMDGRLFKYVSDS
jgi:hypothetical protein